MRHLVGVERERRHRLVLRDAALVARDEDAHEECLAEALAGGRVVHEPERRRDLRERARPEPAEVRRERGGRVDGGEVREGEVLQGSHHCDDGVAPL